MTTLVNGPAQLTDQPCATQHEMKPTFPCTSEHIRFGDTRTSRAVAHLRVRRVRRSGTRILKDFHTRHRAV